MTGPDGVDGGWPVVLLDPVAGTRKGWADEVAAGRGWPEVLP